MDAIGFGVRAESAPGGGDRVCRASAEAFCRDLSNVLGLYCLFATRRAGRRIVSEKRPGDRVFGLVLGVVFGVIALIGWFVSGRILAWAVGISGSFLVLALLAPGVLMPLNRIWSWLGVRIAFAINHLLLGVFFYLVILPFGLSVRLLRRRLMLKRPDPSLESYWSPVGRQATAETYPDLF
jgi:hypothetical protein